MRKDSSIINYLHKNKLIGNKYQLERLPLIVMDSSSDFVSNEVNKHFNNVFYNEYVRDHLKDFDKKIYLDNTFEFIAPQILVDNIFYDLHLFPFDQFVFLHDTEDKLASIRTASFGKSDYSLYNIFENKIHVETYMRVGTTSLTLYKDGLFEFNPKYSIKPKYMDSITWHKIKEMSKLDHARIVDGMSNIREICWLTSFLTTAENNDLYPVLKRKNQKKQRNNNSNKKNLQCGGTVLFLNNLPRANDNSTSELNTGIKKRPHQRRGTKYTLKNERYKNHPKYLLEKAMYRKPAWVGDKDSIVGGNTYTYIERKKQ